ncbi:MAG TPA: hypothetical protein VMV33_01750 [Rhodocyclaceae bacterium]|nr:hypothetical protein [Rhodocyclaceae bacterium]
MSASDSARGQIDAAAGAASIRREARTVMDSHGNHPGHIFNHGHRIAPDNIKVLVKQDKREARRTSEGWPRRGERSESSSAFNIDA